MGTDTAKELDAMRANLRTALKDVASCRTALEHAMEMWGVVTGERDATRAELATAREIIDRDTVIIATKDAEIARLNDAVRVLREVMAFRATDPALPVLKSNPFREFATDRRRIGG